MTVHYYRPRSRACSVAIIPEPGDSQMPRTDAHQFQRNFEKILVSLPTTLLVCPSGKADLMA